MDVLGRTLRACKRIYKAWTGKLIAVLAIIGFVIGVWEYAYTADERYLSGEVASSVLIPKDCIGNSTNSIVVCAKDMRGNGVQEDVVVNVRVEGRNIEVYKGKTNADGYCAPVFSLPDYEGDAEIVVRVGHDVFRQTINIKKCDHCAGGTRILIFTDKPIYKPSQIVHIRVLCLEGDSVYKGNITLEIKTPEGDKILKKNLNVNDFGIAYFDFSLAETLPLGTYTINVSAGENYATRIIKVSHYVLPRFKIELFGLKGYYLVDESIKGTLSCHYFFGKPVEGVATVKARVYIGVWKTLYKKTYDLEDGFASITIPPAMYAVGIPENMDNGYMEINVSVRDSSGHEEAKSFIVSIAKEPVILTMLEDDNVINTPSTYYVLAQYPDGKPVENALVLFDTGNQNMENYTDVRGIASFKFTYKGERYVNITLAKGNIHVSHKFNITGRVGIKVFTDDAYYRIGEEVNVHVFCSEKLGYTDNVYYDVVNGNIVLIEGFAHISNGHAQFTFTTTPNMIGTTTIRAYIVGIDNVFGASKSISVKPEGGLNITIEADKSVYNTGDRVLLKLTTTNSTGPVVSAIGVSIVDQSVFEIGSGFTGLEGVYFTLEEDYQKPSYQIIEYMYGERSSIPIPPEKEIKYYEGGERSALWASTYFEKIEYAREIKERSVNMLWWITTTIVLILLVALFFMSIVYYPTFALFASLILMVAGASTFVLNMGISGMMSSTHTAPHAGEGVGHEKAKIGFPQTPPEEMEPEVKVEGEEEAKPTAPMPYNFLLIRNESTWSVDEAVESGGEEAHVKIVERVYFPETWYWNPMIITNESGMVEIGLKAPDSITSWCMEAFANTKKGELGYTTKNITVFNDFFVEPDIPVYVVQHDEFPLNIMIYNYRNESLSINVSIEDDDWFTLLSKGYANIVAKPNSVSNVTFRIRAEKVGVRSVNISALSTNIGDIVRRNITVIPRGKKIESVQNIRLKDNDSAIVPIELMDGRIDGADSGYVKVQAGTDAIVLDGAEQYIQFVRGCGEQSMSTLAIDILAYDIIRNKKDAVEKMFEYENIVSRGIQHELTFLVVPKNGIGRGIVWFPSDNDAHIWLTSWGLITFQDARNAGFDVDENIISDMQAWVESQQNSDGSFTFPEWGLYETANPTLRNKVVAATAYITRALLYSGISPSSTTIQSSLRYIKDNLHTVWNDSYSLALCLLALEYANDVDPVVDDIASRLASMANVENDYAYWSSSTNMITGNYAGYYGYSNPRIIETTAYAVMALYKHGSHDNLVSMGLNYLLMHRTPRGFYSTQDTIVAFQAIKMCSQTQIKHMTVKVLANNETIGLFNIDESTADVTYWLDISKYLGSAQYIKVVSEGEGVADVQVYYEQYIPWSSTNISTQGDLILYVHYNTTEVRVSNTIRVDLYVNYSGSTYIRMLLVEVRAPVGFEFVVPDFDDLVRKKIISNYEVNGREAMLYIKDIGAGDSIHITYNIVALKPIRATIQGIHAYDMYNPGLDAETMPVEISST